MENRKKQPKKQPKIIPENSNENEKTKKYKINKGLL